MARGVGGGGLAVGAGGQLCEGLAGVGPVLLLLLLGGHGGGVGRGCGRELRTVQQRRDGHGMALEVRQRVQGGS